MSANADTLARLLSIKYKNVLIGTRNGVIWTECSQKNYPNVLFILINHNKALTKWGDLQQLDDPV